MATVKNIIEDAVMAVLLLPKDEIQTDIRDLCLSVVNVQGRIIWDSWPFDNEKIDEFLSPASDSDGIITFGSTVDVIRSIRSVPASSDESVPIFAQDDIDAALRGLSVDTERFVYLADSSAGYRRIKVSAAAAAGDYKVLALKKFVTYQSTAVGGSGYDATRDYSLVSFALDRAEPALRAFVEDALRTYMGLQTVGNGPTLLALAINRETNQQQREKRVSPRYPAFDDLETWKDGSQL